MRKGSGSRFGSRAFSSLQAQALRSLSLGSLGSGSRFVRLRLKVLNRGSGSSFEVFEPRLTRLRLVFFEPILIISNYLLDFVLIKTLRNTIRVCAPIL